MSAPKLNKELAARIAAADGGEYLAGKDEIADIFALEDADIVELAGLYHPVCATWRITDRGRAWLESLTPPAE
jgi:hypothetical protein